MTVNLSIASLLCLASCLASSLAEENLFEDLENLPIPEAYNSSRVYRVVYIVVGVIAFSVVLIIVCCCCLPCCFFAKRRSRQGTIHQPENGGFAAVDQSASYAMQLPPGQSGFPAQNQSYVPQGGQQHPPQGQYPPQGGQQYPPQGGQYPPQGYPAQPPPYPGPPLNQSYPTKEPAYNPNAAY